MTPKKFTTSVSQNRKLEFQIAFQKGDQLKKVVGQEHSLPLVICTVHKCSVLQLKITVEK